MKFPAIDLLKARIKESPDDFIESVETLCQWISNHNATKTPTTTTAESRYHEGLYDALSLLTTGTTEGYSHWQLLCGNPISADDEKAALALEEAVGATRH